MAHDALVLHPRDPQEAPDPAVLVAALQEIDFIAADAPAAGPYPPGPAFGQHITFMGCAPALAAEGQDLHSVEVSGPSPAPLLAAGDNLRPPRCPACGRSPEDWREQVRAWNGEPAQRDWTCPNCGKTHPLAGLDWRRTAGVARVFVTVWGVFEREGIPGDALLSALGTVTDGPWTYFYLRR
ncbi:MAG TPA: hypothetical protein VKA64_10850 [Gammaproteobacteria bacterium]|nr:hypothetical protein [Gammaproteobacteria bacterium]